MVHEYRDEVKSVKLVRLGQELPVSITRQIKQSCVLLKLIWHPFTLRDLTFHFHANAEHIQWKIFCVNYHSWQGVSRTWKQLVQLTIYRTQSFWQVEGIQVWTNTDWLYFNFSRYPLHSLEIPLSYTKFNEVILNLLCDSKMDFSLIFLSFLVCKY